MILDKPSPKKKRVTKSQIEKTIVENLIALQAVHTDLAQKLDGLTKEISSLLKLFESAAKSFGTHTPDTEKDKEFLNKIDRLLEQNKTIAKGLTLMEDRFKEKVYGENKPPTPTQGKEEFWENTVRAPASGKPIPRF